MSSVTNYSPYDFSVTTSTQQQPWVRSVPRPSAGQVSWPGRLADAQGSAAALSLELSTSQTAEATLESAGSMLGEMYDIALRVQGGATAAGDPERFAELAADVAELAGSDELAKYELRSAANLSLVADVAQSVNSLVTAMRDVGNARARNGFQQARLERSIEYHESTVGWLNEMASASGTFSMLKQFLETVRQQLLSRGEEAIAAQAQAMEADAVAQLTSGR